MESEPIEMKLYTLVPVGMPEYRVTLVLAHIPLLFKVERNVQNEYYVFVNGAQYNITEFDFHNLIDLLAGDSNDGTETDEGPTEPVSV